MRTALVLPVIAMVIALGGCVTQPTFDDTELRVSRPRSILVLPPLNESKEPRATYVVLSQTTFPIAEKLGYYVMPVAIVEREFIDRGFAGPAEMHTVPIETLSEIFGADSVLYLTIKNYGNKYRVIGSYSIAHLAGRLVDCRTGVTLWEGEIEELPNEWPTIEPVSSLLSHLINKAVNQADLLAEMAVDDLLVSTPPGYPRPRQGLLKGPYHPEFGKD